MRTLLPDPPPPEIERIIERRRASGADIHDEVWEGVLHMMPAPHSTHGKLDRRVARLLDPPAQKAKLELSGPVNIGSAQDYRVPDGALLEPEADGVYLPTAALVVEILSPGDETFAKLPFYAAHKVDEVLIVDPQQRTVQWLARNGDSYTKAEGSRLIDLDAPTLQRRIEWL